MKRRKPKRKLVAEINVVPYIDVTLVLMVIFMITAPLLMQGVKVELPTANSAPSDWTIRLGERWQGLRFLCYSLW